LQALLVQKDKVLENCEKERIDMNLTLISKHKELEICKQEIKTVNKQLRKKKKEQKKQIIEHDKQLKQALQKAKRESQLEQQKVIDHMQEINDFQVQMISAYKELGHGAHSDQTPSPDKLVYCYQVLADLQDQTIELLKASCKEHIKKNA
jgi:multidrug resistance efflux pump